MRLSKNLLDCEHCKTLPISETSYEKIQDNSYRNLLVYVFHWSVSYEN